MTKKHGLTKGERFEQMEKRVKNLEMGMRVMQMVTQQLGNQIDPISKDVSELAARQRELQYRAIAIQELVGLSMDVINKRSEELQIKDFNEASDKEDAEKDYTVADVVGEDSIVILSTTTPDENTNKGFLRSKVQFKELGFPQFREDLLGKQPGDVFHADINGVKHLVTVLGVRTAPAAVETPAETLQVDGQTLQSLNEESVVNGAAAQ